MFIWNAHLGLMSCFHIGVSMMKMMVNMSPSMHLVYTALLFIVCVKIVTIMVPCRTNFRIPIGADITKSMAAIELVLY